MTIHPFTPSSVPTPGTPRRPRPTQPPQPPPGLGIKQALDPPQPAHHILVLLPPSPFHSRRRRRPRPRPLPPRRRHRALTPPMPPRRRPSPSGPHPHPHQTLIPQHLHQHFPPRRRRLPALVLGSRIPLRGAVLPRTKKPMLPQRIEIVHRRRDQNLLCLGVDLAALEHPEPQAAEARVARGRVGDLAEAGVGEALPAEEGECEGGAVWGFGCACGCGWGVGEEGGGEVGQDGVEVEGGREAEVEVVGEEGGAGDEVVVALAEGGEGEAGVGEGEAEEGVWGGDTLVWDGGTGGGGDIPSHPFFLHRQSCPCPSTISSAYLVTTPSATSDAINTEISLPSTSLRFTPTASSRPHSAHCTRSLPWHVHPRLAHSTSLTRSGLGVQSVSSWNVASRRSSWSRSPGQYLSSDVPPSLADDGAGLPDGVHFRSVTFDIVVCGPLDGDEAAAAATSPYLDGVDGPATRRFLPRYSRSLVPILMVDAGDEKMEGVRAGEGSGPRRARVLAVGGSRPVLCVVEGWASTVAESDAGRLGVSPLLMPWSWRRALNLRLTVEFMLTSAPWGGIMGVIGYVISGGGGGGMDGSGVMAAAAAFAWSAVLAPPL